MANKIRIQKISIESNNENGPVWIHVRGQEMQYNDAGQLVGIIPSNHFSHFTLESAEDKLFLVQDPVTMESHEHSGKALAGAVINAALLSLKDRYGGEIEDDKLCL